MLTCPFCGASESDRFEMEGRSFVVFPCSFTPVVDPTRSDEELQRSLAETYGARGPQYFRETCDRLHLYVTRRTEPDPVDSAATTRSDA